MQIFNMVLFFFVIPYMNFVKVFISSGLAFCISITVAKLIETFGGAIGSAIGTVPSIILPASYIIMTNSALTETEVLESLLGCAYGVFSTSLLFIPSWKWVPGSLPKKWSKGKRIAVSTIITVAIWFIGAIVVMALEEWAEKVGISMFAYCFFLMTFAFICTIFLCWTLPPTPAGKNRVKWYVHLLRGVVSATCIFISGVLSQTGLGVAAGAMATFPAVFCTTIVSVSIAQSPEVITGALGPLIMAGLCSGWYAIVCPIFFCWLHLSALLSLILSWIVSVLFYSIPVYYFVKWRRDATARKVARKVATAEEESKKVEMVEMDVQKTGNEEEKENRNNEHSIEEHVVAPSSNIADSTLVASSIPSANVVIADADDKSRVFDVP